jgi:NADH:ubiquinone oxidoreductase subunit 6 (subunit J)
MMHRVDGLFNSTDISRELTCAHGASHRERKMIETLKLIFIIAVLILAALATLRARSLLLSALWLAGVSAMISTLLYTLSAHQVAVIELSVGAGLVTIFFIFVISAAGDEQVERSSVIPGTIAAVLVIVAVTLLIILGRSSNWVNALPTTQNLANRFTQIRGLDLLVQVVLIFAGVLGLVEILAEAKAPLDHPMADEIAVKREHDLQSLEQESRRPVEDARRLEHGLITPTDAAPEAPQLR